ncbi:SRPBCC family protein [Verminephrobacter eiseniae]|uniref:hypothetical protein n=1 Tax=Verminephrobacter eiseniae TaxID=364317 RepID=UPI002238D91A|nr:hypothetical protein [Verminephrobacter eiseniae]MCW5238698.1 hypothetical protein [Verminephrobacter eiseniae]
MNKEIITRIRLDANTAQVRGVLTDFASYLRTIPADATELIHSERFSGWLLGTVFGSIRADTERGFVAMNEALQQRLGARAQRAAKRMCVMREMCLCPARPATFARVGQGGPGRARGSDQIKAWFSGAPSTKP